MKIYITKKQRVGTQTVFTLCYGGVSFHAPNIKQKTLSLFMKRKKVQLLFPFLEEKPKNYIDTIYI